MYAVEPDGLSILSWSNSNKTKRYCLPPLAHELQVLH